MQLKDASQSCFPTLHPNPISIPLALCHIGLKPQWTALHCRYFQMFCISAWYRGFLASKHLNETLAAVMSSGLRMAWAIWILDTLLLVNTDFTSTSVTSFLQPKKTTQCCVRLFPAFTDIRYVFNILLQFSVYCFEIVSDWSFTGKQSS